MSRSDRALRGIREPGDDRFQPRRVALIGALTAVSFVVVALLTLLVRVSGGGDDAFDEEFLAACRRSDAPEDRCRCALGEWNATLDVQARRDLDMTLAEDGELPTELGSALERC